MKRLYGSSTGLFTIGITALFFAGFLLLIIFGAQSYQRTVAGQDRNMNSRASLSYISACIKAYDTQGAIRVRDTDYGSTLVLAESGADYGLFIYRSGGYLMEQYMSLDAVPDAEHAERICAAGTFAVEEDDSGLLRITTDDGSVLLHPRCEEGTSS